MKKGTKEKRERKGRKKRLFLHFFWVSWHSTYGIDYKIFSAPNCRGWRSFVFYHGARNQTCRCSEEKRCCVSTSSFFPLFHFFSFFRI